MKDLQKVQKELNDFALRGEESLITAFKSSIHEIMGLKKNRFLKLLSMLVILN